MNGILLLDKPMGWTSFDVVAKVRGILRKEVGKIKVGHTGTLDPLATGLLVLLVGSATKRAPELTKLDKAYEVTLRLGQTSTTGDEEGQKIDVSSAVPTEAEVHAALRKFVGQIEQTPPSYSAIKINGQRAYKLARAGKEVKLEPRSVTIYEMTEVSYEYPLVSFTAKVSSGTYIRTLAEDIGQTLCTGAYTTRLHRTMVGQFSIKDALAMTEISSEALLSKKGLTR
jgi:tRNA pseudouridine55 synthase